jgi:hypothetical protein
LILNINLTAAKTLGVRIPESFHARADRVIEITSLHVSF